ncbi:hypothetical protein QOT17_023007 [Balamuthia mandrillaris]
MQLCPTSSTQTPAPPLQKPLFPGAAPLPIHQYSSEYCLLGGKIILIMSNCFLSALLQQLTHSSCSQPIELTNATEVVESSSLPHPQFKPVGSTMILLLSQHDAREFQGAVQSHSSKSIQPGSFCNNVFGSLGHLQSSSVLCAILLSYFPFSKVLKSQLKDPLAQLFLHKVRSLLLTIVNLPSTAPTLDGIGSGKAILWFYCKPIVQVSYYILGPCPFVYVGENPCQYISCFLTISSFQYSKLSAPFSFTIRLLISYLTVICTD